MTPKERAIAALTLKQPDEVPTFELEFQLRDEMFGPFPWTWDDLKPEVLDALPSAEAEKRVYEYCAAYSEMYKKLEYSIWPFIYMPDMWVDNELGKYQKMAIKYCLEFMDNKYMFHAHGDGTFALPDGNGMYDFAYRLYDDYDSVLEQAENMCVGAIERNKKLIDAGVETLILCSDYCYNVGPFVSPEVFSNIITPYLERIVRSGRENGAYVIKHTDGNIMPIIDQLVQCNPHALHSIDPMAKVDIKEVKEKWGDKVCLCGNVNCALMQTGTEEEVIESAAYCMKYGKPNGGYFFCTSNVPFKGLPAERYQLILDYWKKNRKY